MNSRNSCRPRVEQLEQRDVPAGPALTGTHGLNTTFTLQVVSAPFLSISGLSGSGTLVLQGHLGSGLLKNATVMFSGTATREGSSSVYDFSGSLIFTIPKQGVVITTDTGKADINALTFTDNGMIQGGSGKFRGTTGNFTANGTVSVSLFPPPPTATASGTLTGTITGAAVHHHRRHH